MRQENRTESKNMGLHQCPIEPNDWSDGPDDPELVDCRECQGQGKTPEGAVCKECDGQGMVPPDSGYDEIIGW